MSADESLITEAQAEGISRIVVGAVILSGERVLILKRPEGDFMGGIFELPSGKLENGETITAALHREVKEETGLQIRMIDEYLGCFDYRSGSGKDTRQLNFLITAESTDRVLLSEHDAYAWAAFEELDGYEITASTRAVLDAAERLVRGIDLASTER